MGAEPNNMADTHYDLVLVGTGFASTFFLMQYQKHTEGKKRILVLERGDLLPHADRVASMRDGTVLKGINWEKAASVLQNSTPDKPWIFDPNFGGSSNCWTGCTPRFMPNDFKMNSTYGVGSDWPITYEELEPYYCAVETLMGISGPNETPFPRSMPYPLPPHPLSKWDRLIQNKYPGLYISQPTARPTQPIGQRPVCCSSSVCNLCPIDSKFTIGNSYSDVYHAPNVTISYQAIVLKLEISNKSAKGVWYRSAGKDQFVSGDLVALGANAIFNAHILLNSGDTSNYTGRGLSEQAGTYAYFYLDGVENVGGGSIIPANGYMMYDVPERASYSGCLIESHNTTFIRSEPGKWRQIARMKFIFENLPEDENRVLPSDDPLKPKLVFNGHSSYATKAMEQLESNVEKYFGGLPIEKIYFDGFFQKSEYHITSTTRMSTEPGSGVIDDALLHHQYRNVLVLGSGAFPTMTPANPSLTISALSLRAADKLFL